QACYATPSRQWRQCYESSISAALRFLVAAGGVLLTWRFYIQMVFWHVRERFCMSWDFRSRVGAIHFPRVGQCGWDALSTMASPSAFMPMSSLLARMNIRNWYGFVRRFASVQNCGTLMKSGSVRFSQVGSTIQSITV